MIRYLLLATFLILAPIQAAYQSNDSELKIYFVSKNDTEFSISSIEIDKLEDLKILTTIPTTFNSTIRELFTDHEIEFMQSYVEEAPNHGLNIPESSMDLDRDRQFSTSIEGMLAAHDNQKVAVTAKHSFCLLEFYSETCFGVYEILTVDTDGVTVPVSKIGMHETDEPFLRDCTGIPRFHIMRPELVDWTFDSKSLVITTEGLGSCFSGGRVQPLVLVGTTVQTAPMPLDIGKQLALQSHRHLAAISNTQCFIGGGCTTAVSIVEYGDGQASISNQVRISDLSSQQIFWLSENRVLLFGLDLRPLEQQIPVAIILNIETDAAEYHELETPIRIAKMSVSRNRIVMQQRSNELALLDVDTPFYVVPFYIGELQDWKTGPDDLILIQPTEEPEWHIIDVKGGLIKKFTLPSGRYNTIFVDW